MKILLSAYGFAPKGSEAGVGWGWALELIKRGHEVWVLTPDPANRDLIENYIKKNGLPDALKIVYVRWPETFLKVITNRLPWSHYWEYFAWQKLAYNKATELHEQEQFDLVQHITWGSIRTLSYMGELGIPFVYGPAGGGERTPRQLRSALGIKGRIIEFIRNETLRFKLSRAPMKAMFAKTRKIYVTTEESKLCLPESVHDKTDVALAIGVDESVFGKSISKKDGAATKLLFAARFESWKGMTLGLKAFALACQKNPKLHLTMVGSGTEENNWKKLANSLGIADNIKWVSWVTLAELEEIYLSHDLFLFPSFHDTGGIVVLDTLSRGMPTVCLDLGGPNLMVNENCGRVIGAKNRSVDEVIVDLADAIILLGEDAELYHKLSAGALERARELTWPKVIESSYQELETAFKP